MMSDSQKTPYIILIENGPLKISGNYKLVNDSNEEISSGSELYLCRCGKSSNAPYCDGSHKNEVKSAKENTPNTNCE